MGSMLVAAKCNMCNSIFKEIWVNRDKNGYPDFAGIPCGNCGKKCLLRCWEEQKVNPIIPPLENGEVNRFEYEFRDDNGKKHTRKVDPSIVKKHYERNGK